jgi:hypothetical protein
MGTKEEVLIERVLKEDEEFLRRNRLILSSRSNWKSWREKPISLLRMRSRSKSSRRKNWPQRPDGKDFGEIPLKENSGVME